MSKKKALCSDANISSWKYITQGCSGSLEGWDRFTQKPYEESCTLTFMDSYQEEMQILYDTDNRINGYIFFWGTYYEPDSVEHYGQRDTIFSKSL